MGKNYVDERASAWRENPRGDLGGESRARQGITRGIPGDLEGIPGDLQGTPMLSPLDQGITNFRPGATDGKTAAVDGSNSRLRAELIESLGQLERNRSGIAGLDIGPLHHVYEFALPQYTNGGR